MESEFLRFLKNMIKAPLFVQLGKDLLQISLPLLKLHSFQLFFTCRSFSSIADQNPEQANCCSAEINSKVTSYFVTLACRSCWCNYGEACGDLMLDKCSGQPCLRVTGPFFPSYPSIV